MVDMDSGTRVTRSFLSVREASMSVYKFPFLLLYEDVGGAVIGHPL